MLKYVILPQSEGKGEKAREVYVKRIKFAPSEDKKTGERKLIPLKPIVLRMELADEKGGQRRLTWTSTHGTWTWKKCQKTPQYVRNVNGQSMKDRKGQKVIDQMLPPIEEWVILHRWENDGDLLKGLSRFVPAATVDEILSLFSERLSEIIGQREAA